MAFNSDGSPLIPSQQPTSVGGGGGSQSAEQRLQNRRDAQGVEAARALSELGVSMDQATRRLESALNGLGGGARSGAAPDFTTRGAE